MKEAVEAAQEIVKKYSLSVPCVRQIAALLSEALYRMIHLVHMCEEGDLELEGSAFLAHVKQINHLQLRAVGILRDEGVSEEDTNVLIQQLMALLEAQDEPGNMAG